MTVYLIAANVRPSLFKDLSQSEESWIASDRKLLILRMERCWSGRSGTLGKRSVPAIPSHSEGFNTHAISDLAFQNYQLVCVGNLDILRSFEPDVSQSYHNRPANLRASSSVFMGAPPPPFVSRRD